MKENVCQTATNFEENLLRKPTGGTNLIANHRVIDRSMALIRGIDQTIATNALPPVLTSFPVIAHAE